MQCQIMEFVAAENSGEEKQNFLKGLVKQWSDASIDSGRF